MQPGMVYISHPTENGTLYTKKELMDLYEVCKKYDMLLFLDGARLGYGLAVEDTDVTMEDIAEYCDIFYIGGTKVGAFCGEAVVFTKDNAPRHFVTLIKQHGALLAKGWFLGVQFDTLFTDDLYMEISKNAIETAARLKEILKEKGYILNYKFEQDGVRSNIKIALKYHPETKVPAIKSLIRVSKPGLRRYTNVEEMPRVLNGLGIAILSTSMGLMTDKEARQRNVGGEVLCYVY